jgi:3-hydroxyisobutyrate dehydrogenase
MMRIGYIGVGNMGGALAGRLQLVYPLIVYDRSEAAIRVLAEKGARVAAGPAEIAAECDFIFLCLPTSQHVREVLFGTGGLGEALKPGTLIVDQTTGDPHETRAMARELDGRGVSMIDAPVSGGKAGAAGGTIAIMVGADRAQFDRVLPILEAISPNVFHAGGVGNGHVVKLVNNLMSAVQRALSFEAIAMAAKNGVEPRITTDILLAGGGRNAYLEKMMKPRILEGRLDVGFTLGLAHKDMRLACQLGTDSGVPMFLGSAARELYQLSISQMGRDSQVDTIGQVFDGMAGTQVVPTDNDLDRASFASQDATVPLPPDTAAASGRSTPVRGEDMDIGRLGSRPSGTQSPASSNRPAPEGTR